MLVVYWVPIPARRSSSCSRTNAFQAWIPGLPIVRDRPQGEAIRPCKPGPGSWS